MLAGRHDLAKASSPARVSAVSVGLPVNLSARASAVGASSSASYFSSPQGSMRLGRSAYVTISERPRQVEVSSHDASSQPDTFGGWNRCWPERSPSHDQEVVSMPRPSILSSP